MNISLLLAALIGSGGLVGSIIAFFKLKPERESIIVTAAQGAVILQSSVVKDLADELERTQKQFAELEQELRGEITEMFSRLEQVTVERNDLKAERDELKGETERLRTRVGELEARVQELENGGTKPADARG